MLSCLRCGREIPRNSVKCPYCGVTLVEQDPQVTAQLAAFQAARAQASAIAETSEPELTEEEQEAKESQQLAQSEAEAARLAASYAANAVAKMTPEQLAALATSKTNLDQKTSAELAALRQARASQPTAKELAEQEARARAKAQQEAPEENGLSAVQMAALQNAGGADNPFGALPTLYSLNQSSTTTDLAKPRTAPLGPVANLGAATSAPSPARGGRKGRAQSAGGRTGSKGSYNPFFNPWTQCFSVSGRATRTEYLFGYVWWFLLVGLRLIIPLAGIVLLFWMIAFICLSIRRVHDFDYEGYLVFIPLYNMLILAYMFFRPGTNGPNQFGDDPRSR